MAARKAARMAARMAAMSDMEPNYPACEAHEGRLTTLDTYDIRI
jgi:hypothetical protein